MNVQTVRLHRKTVERLERIAKERGIPLTTLMREILDRYLNKVAVEVNEETTDAR